MKYTSSQLLKNPNGGFKGRIMYKDEETGKWRSKTKKLESKGKRDAGKELDAWKQDMNDAAELEARIKAHPEERDTTVAEYVASYIESRRPHIEKSTLSEYNRLLNKHIAPAFGNTALSKLDPDAVQEWVNSLLDRYAPVTVRKAFTLLKSAMTQAVNRDRIAKNPTRTVEVPKFTPSKPNAMTERDRSRVLHHLLSDPEPNAPMVGIAVALLAGLRRGEICGLRWRDVDTDARTLAVEESIGYDGKEFYEKAPKTEGSARTVCIPERLAAMLRAHRTRMAEACLEAGLPFSPSLFALGAVDGTPLSPQTLYRRWKALAELLEVTGADGRPLTFHDLRHTYATTAIAAGVDVKTVAEQMGHSDASMTLNTYAAPDRDAQHRAAEAVARSMQAQPETIIELEGTGTDGR